MFTNYFKTAWRNLIKNKAYSILNIMGLAIGMAVALLIGLWSYNEYSYDRFLPNYEQLYQVKKNFNNNGQILTFNSASLKLADVLRSQFPEIEYVAESDWMVPHGLRVADKKFYLAGAQINSDFLKMFQYPLLEGNANTVLSDPYSIVLTQSTAKTLFGDAHPIGQTVRFDNQHELKVTGILKDLPANSSLSFNYLVPFSYYEQNDAMVKFNRAAGFEQNSYQVFIRLKQGASYASLANKIKDIEKIDRKNINFMNTDVILHALKDWHLYSEFRNGQPVTGFIEYVRMFSAIGLLVLLIACINFINLTTARSRKRQREVGVRKVMGSQRKNLVLQFLTESFLLTFISFILSLALVQLALPAFNTLTGRTIQIPFTSGKFWLATMICMLITALIAGSRPAFYLSSFQPVKVLKGSMQWGHAVTLPRKILVVLQFSCSVALIISTVIIYRQIQYAKSRPSGFELSRLMFNYSSDDLSRNYTALKNELLQQGVIENMTHSTSPATNVYWHSDVEQWPGKQPNETVRMGVVVTGEDYFKTMGMSLLMGRDFNGSADTTSVVFNEAAVKQMRLKEPLNQVINFQGKNLRIAGVYKDALMVSPFAPAEPTIFLRRPGQHSAIIYRLSPTINPTDALAKLTAAFNKYNPAYPYNFEFADASYAQKFNLEILIGKLAGLFAGLAIFTSCLGLFGLAAYMADQRTREIGIRKILGASLLQLWVILTRDFIILVLISCLIASPLALYFLQNWLQQYAWRVTIGLNVFLIAAGAAIAITLLTVSLQAIKAAVANPVKSLRSE
ncbi:ABC transporter permease [Niastella sp. OAS944]|uniref:ABC transporter permease n=1 Tax=Niastella sp. OAS944 TaxID=2664089 RepID=UPI00347D5787|nr:ABC-type antimicrobial peptide transport system permease subunit [Chitinophagaceae bacterium OAS944]